MRFWIFIRAVNERGVALGFLGLLLWVASVCHRIALSSLALFGGTRPEPRFAASIALLRWVHAHPAFWVVLLLFYAYCLVWLELRHAPRWSVWAVLVAFAVPTIAYAWICFAVGTAGYMGPLR